MTGKIVVVGSSNTDMIVRVPDFPKSGETLLGDNFMLTQGGKGANQAVAASRAGGNVYFIACVGKDHFGQDSVKSYVDDGINVTGVIYDNAAPSGAALIFVTEAGENAIAVALGANAKLTPAHIEAEKSMITSADAVLLQLETPFETVIRTAEIAHEAQVPVILNPAPAKTLPRSFLSKVSYLTPNQSEAEKITGIAVIDEKSAQSAASYLLDHGVGTVVLTLGNEGALIATPKEFLKVPGFRVSTVDTTAAGDTFNGAFAVALGEKLSLVDAVRFANAAAALTVTQKGTQTAIPLRKAIDVLMAGHSK